MRKVYMALLTVVLSLCLLLPGTPVLAADGTAEIVVLHTNDTHGRIEPKDDSGKSIGFPEIAAAVKNVRALNPDTLLLDAGDTLHGTPDINISRGENMTLILNELGYDAMAPGNHDFNYGSARLVELSRELHFPVLSANIVDAQTGKLLFAPYKEFVLDGVRVAVFGLTTAETAFKTSPENVKNVKFLDPIEAARKMVKKLRKNHDVIIAITHLGIDASSKITSEMVAAQVPGIDVMIDGHSHTVLTQGMTTGNTLIAQTGCYDHNLGCVRIQVKDHKVISKTASLYTPEELKAMAPEPDKAMQATIDGIRAQNQAVFAVVAAQSPRKLSSDRGIVRRHESELGNLAADALRWESGADIAMTNGGSLRADLPQGPVTKGDIMAIFPFGNTLEKVEISGAVLKAVLEHSVEYYPAAFGGFMQVSGVTFTFDPAAEAGHRVQEVQVGGAPLELMKNYTLAINDFNYAGGDGYSMLKGAKVVAEFGTYEEILTAYLNRYGIGDVSLGRITMLGEAVERQAA